MAGRCHHPALPPDAILSLATPAMAIGFNGRTVIARCVPRISSVVPHSSALRLRHDVSPYSALLAHPCSTLASLSALAPSFLPLRSSVIRHATTCSGSCSYDASIILACQINPYSAYSAEQNWADFSQRVVRLGEIPLELSRLRLPTRICRGFVPRLAPPIWQACQIV